MQLAAVLPLMIAASLRRLRRDHPDGVSACKLCETTGCGECYTGLCQFAEIEYPKGEIHPSIAGPPYDPEPKQDFCADWTWHCGAVEVENYFECATYERNLELCDECSAGCGTPDCFVGICDEYCSTRSFS